MDGRERPAAGPAVSASRGIVIPPGCMASLDALNVAALTLAERVTLASETIGLALAVSVCWPPGLDPS